MKARIQLAAFLVSTLSVQATNLVWNNAGPTNAWNLADLNWTPNQAFVSGDNVSFTSAGESVSVLAGGVTVGTMTVNSSSSSYAFTGGPITGALIKTGANGLRFDSANSFTSVSASGGPYSQTDGAFRLGAVGALGTADVTFTNTANMTGLYFLTGFGNASTFSNNIAFTSSAVTTRLVTTAGLNLPTGQIVTLSGLLTGGSSTSIIQTDNSAASGVSRIKLTNASNSVQLQYWNLNRGGLEFTSDAALGNSANGLRLDVTTSNSGTGLIFGADNITTAATRAVTVQTSTVIDTQAFTGSQINGAVTMTGLIYKQGSGTLTFNGTGTGTGGIRVDAGSVLVGTGSTTGTIGTGNVAFNATGTNLTFNRSDALSFSGNITGTGSLTKKAAGVLTLSGTNSYSAGTTIDGGSISIAGSANIGSGDLSFNAAGTGLTITGTAVTLANNFALGNVSGNISIVTPNSSSTILNGTISGGGANTVWYFQGGGSGQNTGALTLNGTNSLQGTINVQRGPLILGNSSAAGSAKILLDSNNNAAGSLQFSSSFSISNAVQLGTASERVGVGGSQTNTLSGVVSGSGIEKVGSGTLILSNANNTYTGATLVSAGALYVNGKLANTTTTVNAGTLGGTGTISGSVTINNTATLAAGASPGSLELGANLSLGTNATTAVELGGTNFTLNGTEDYDRIKLTSSSAVLTLGGTLSLSLVNSFALAENQAFGLFQLDSAATRSGTFSGLTTDGSLVGNYGGMDVFITYSGNFGDSGTVSTFGGNDIVLYTVPEPGAALLGGLGLLALLRRRR